LQLAIYFLAFQGRSAQKAAWRRLCQTVPHFKSAMIRAGVTRSHEHENALTSSLGANIAQINQQTSADGTELILTFERAYAASIS
jgi:hypothetical protein